VFFVCFLGLFVIIHFTMNESKNANPFAISVVIPAYNSAAHIGRAIDSVLAQTQPPAEIIVVDDGSTDDTPRIVQGYGDQVRRIEQANAGASAARNTGILAARGDWIALLDADDEWLPTKLALQTAILQRYPHLSWVTGNYLTCSCNEHRQAPYIRPHEAQKRLIDGLWTADYLLTFAQGLGGHTDTMLIRKAVLLEAGLFRPEQPKANDLDMWWRVAYLQPAAGYVAEPTAIYHLAVPNSISKRPVNAEHYCDLISRHWALARQYGRLDSFQTMASHVLRRWLRSMLFDAQAQDIRRILTEFQTLFPTWYRLWMHLLTTVPNATAAGCHGLSKIVRRFHLRRRVVLPPAPRQGDSQGDKRSD
jgi:glycosyltransferase involved in cell wall biosynthesis